MKNKSQANKRRPKKIIVGIPFFINNNFYGNKLFYPALNSHQRTVKYVFGRLPWLKPIFFSVKRPVGNLGSAIFRGGLSALFLKRSLVVFLYVCVHVLKKSS